MQYESADAGTAAPLDAGEGAQQTMHRRFSSFSLAAGDVPITAPAPTKPPTAASPEAQHSCVGLPTYLRFIPKAVGARIHARPCMHLQVADAQGPPPWHDEGLEAEFQSSSLVLQPPFQQFLKAVDCGEVSVDVIKHDGGVRELHLATSWADIPAMKALLRRGARIDAFSFMGSPLQTLCGMMSQMGEFHAEKPNRSLLKALYFLLNVGANPNALPSVALGDIDPHPGDPVGPLEVAVSIRDSQLAKRVVELLIRHDADPASHPRGGARTVFNAAPALMQRSLRRLLKLRRIEGTPRPARLCPCGSERLFDACHGNRDQEGESLHPKALCPCRGEKGKTYTAGAVSKRE
jgi:hypothetical protein